MPYQLAIISRKHRKYKQVGWSVYGPTYKPEESLGGHMTFALKYEGINLLFFKKLFEVLPQHEVVALVQTAYTGQYMRKVWFLYEWLMQKQLPLPDLTIKKGVPLLDESLQYAAPVPINSTRHRIQNNLPGTPAFCPLVYRTGKLEEYVAGNLNEKMNRVFSGVHKNILLRTSAFLLLKDSKASFTIEGENPTQSRAARWGRAIGQAGTSP